MSENKDRLNFRMKPETAEKLEHWYKADHCRSKNEFVETTRPLVVVTAPGPGSGKLTQILWRRRTAPRCRWPYRLPSTGG